MAENSKIEWTTHTFNHVRGCTKVSPECANCYAETLSHRNPGTLGVWGPNGTRVVASESMWREPVKWENAAELAYEEWLHSGDHEGPSSPPPERPRVFCASLADVFEDWDGTIKNAAGFDLWHLYPPSGSWVSNPGDAKDKVLLTMADVRARLFRLIDATPNLDWLLLTKRPENIATMMPAYFPGGYIAEAGTMNQEGVRPNVWLGTSVGVRKTLSRIDVLRQIPAAVRFLSIEPLLEDLGPLDLTGIHWVIVGGESGHDARHCRVEWIRDIVKQCKAANVPCFVKQMGQNIIDRNDSIGDYVSDSYWPEDTEVKHNINGFREQYQGADVRIVLADKKGGDISEWPVDLRVRDFPRVEVTT